MGSKIAQPFTLGSVSQNRCYITLRFPGNADIPLKGHMISVTASGVWFEYEWQGEILKCVHGYQRDEEGKLIPRQPERTQWNRPHFLVMAGSGSDSDWVTGLPTSDASVISAVVRSDILPKMVSKVTGEKKGFKLNPVMIIIVVCILGAAAFFIPKAMNTNSVNPTATTKPPITTIIRTTMPPVTR